MKYVYGFFAGLFSLVLVVVGFIGGLGELPTCSVDPAVGNGDNASLSVAANPSIEQAVVSQSKGDNKLAASLLFGGHLESGWRSVANTKWHSYGWLQIQNPVDDPIPRVVHDDITIAEAMDPGKATAYMLPAYKLALTKQARENPGLWLSDPRSAALRVAYLAERPAVQNYGDRAKDFAQAWTDTLEAMKRNGIPTTFTNLPPVVPPISVLNPSAPPNGPPAGDLVQDPAGTGCDEGVTAGGPVGQPGIVSGDAVTLAKQVMALEGTKVKFTPGFGGREDFLATANGQLLTPGSGGTCRSHRPVPVSAALSQVILDVTKGPYSITIGSTISNHQCDQGRHPVGRAIDINYINGVVITGSATQFSTANQGLYRQFMDYVQSVLPRGQWAGSKPVGMGGLGQQQCFRAPRPEVPGLNIFPDACTHIHIDVGVAAG